MSGFNVGEWLGQILKYLAISVDMRVRIGFSFVGVTYKKQIPEYIYFFAALDLSEINERFYYPQDAQKFAEELKKYNERDYMQKTFLNSQSGKVFDTSGIGPYCLVACYIWITK